MGARATEGTGANSARELGKGWKISPCYLVQPTEDYFGGSYDWDLGRKYTLYNSLYMGLHQLIQSDVLYHHQQRFSLYRWHILDSICFDENIKVTIQDLGWKIPGELYLCRRDDFASVHTGIRTSLP